jgi:ABC-type phosphate transport system permease subunit
MRHSRLQSFVLLAVLLVPMVASACPDCATSQVVKASVLGEGFWSYLVMLVVPFLLIGALSAFLYRIGLQPPGMTSARARNEPEGES